MSHRYQRHYYIECRSGLTYQQLVKLKTIQGFEYMFNPEGNPPKKFRRNRSFSPPFASFRFPLQTARSIWISPIYASTILATRFDPALEKSFNMLDFHSPSLFAWIKVPLRAIF